MMNMVCRAISATIACCLRPVNEDNQFMQPDKGLLRTGLAQAAASAARPPSDRLSAGLELGLALLLSLFLMWPLLQNPGLPNGTDTFYHIQRVAEMDRLWSQGLLLPRWAASFYYGYGSPLFHYYASLTYHLTSVLMRIPGFDAVEALRALIVLCALAAGGGMFLWLRARVSALAGYIAAAAYVYTPYLLYQEPYARGDFPELLALALFPVIMWLFERLLQRGRGVDFALAAGGVLLLINAHNLMAVALAALLAAWLCWNTLAYGWRRAGLSLVALAVGVGLAASFWLPVILERDAVQLGNLIALAELDYRNFFIPLTELLAYVPRLDSGAINGLLPVYRLGLAQWLLALVGMLAALLALRRWGASSRRNDLHLLVFMALAGAGLVFLITPQSESVWRLFSPLSYLQFPWRLIGPAAFCLAALAGLNALWLERLPGRAGTGLAALLIALPVAAGMPLFHVTEWKNTDVDTSVAAYHQTEIDGMQFGTTYSGEFLPASVLVVPDATPRLLADYADGYPVDRIHYAALPTGVTVDLVQGAPQANEWRIQADHAFTLEVLLFDFPGWTAEIDGQPVPIHPSDPHGLITFDVPAGAHTVRLYLGQTPARDLGRGLALLALALLALALWRLRWGGQPPEPLPAVPAARRAALIAVGLQLVVMAVFMRPGVAWLESPPGQALAARQAVRYDLGDSIRLIGYDLHQGRFRPDDRLELVLYWYAAAPVEYGYRSFVHVSNGGAPLAQADKLNPAGRPTVEWTSEGYLHDPYVIELPHDLPSGTYTLYVGLYTCDTRPPGECGNGDRLPVTDADDLPLGDAVPLAQIEVW
jgi:hypothetical protein